MYLPRSASQILSAIVVLNLISTWLHYTDNALFVDRYPGPAWFTTSGIFGAILLMTPIGLLGHLLYINRRFGFAYLMLGVYSITGVSSPGHYLFPMTVPMSIKMHSLIWLDGVSGILLISFLAWSSFLKKEWKSAHQHNAKTG